MLFSLSLFTQEERPWQSARICWRWCVSRRRPTIQTSFRSFKYKKNKNEWFTARHLHNVSASRRGNYKSSLALLLRGVYLLRGCTRLCNSDAEWAWKQRWIKTSSIRTYHYPLQGRNFQCSSDEERLGTPTVRSDRWKPERSLRSNLEFLACLLLS